MADEYNAEAYELARQGVPDVDTELDVRQKFLETGYPETIARQQWDADAAMGQAGAQPEWIYSHGVGTMIKNPARAPAVHSALGKQEKALRTEQEYEVEKYRMSDELDTSSEEGAGEPLAATPGQGQQTAVQMNIARGGLADQALKTLVGYQNERAINARETGEKAAFQRNIMEGVMTGGIEEAQRRAVHLQEAYDEAIVDYASIRVNPKRWEQSTPAVAQVLMGLASGAFAFFTGGRGVNPVTDLIDRAIERDVRAQMSNAKNKLGKAQMGIDKEVVIGKLESNIRAAMWDRAVGALDGIMQKGQSEDLYYALKAEGAATLHKHRAVHEARQEKYIMAAMTAEAKVAAAANKPLKPYTPTEMKNRVAQSAMILEGVSVLKDLHGLMREGQQLNPITGSSIWTKITTLFSDQKDKLTGLSERDKFIAGDIKNKAATLATRLARATGVEVGNFAIAEANRFIAAIVGQQWDVAPTAYRELMRKLHEQRELQRAADVGLARHYDHEMLAPLVAKEDEAWNTLMGVPKRKKK